MIARVFVRRTKATPTDPYAFVGEPPLFIPEDITEVKVSVVFTWDIDEGLRLLKAWERIAPASIGGPAFGAKTFFLFRAMSGWHLAVRPEEIDEFVFHPVSREKAKEAWEGGRLYEGQKVGR